jgi:hypothetical protein
MPPDPDASAGVAGATGTQLFWSDGGVIGGAMGSPATDAVVSAADIFASKRASDGWVEIA